MGGSSSPASNPAPFGRNRDGTASTEQERNAWNQRRRDTGLSGEALYKSLTKPVDPYAQFYEMFAEGQSTNHNASVPGQSPAEIADKKAADAAEAKITGGNNLQSAYDNYLGIAKDATAFVNRQISDERSNSALLGNEYKITDEDKAGRIDTYFSSIFTADDWSNLQDLNTEFGADRDNQLSFSVTRGGDSSGAVDSKTKVADKGRQRVGISGTNNLLDDQLETLGSTTFLGA